MGSVGDVEVPNDMYALNINLKFVKEQKVTVIHFWKPL